MIKLPGKTTPLASTEPMPYSSQPPAGVPVATVKPVPRGPITPASSLPSQQPMQQVQPTSSYATPGLSDIIDKVKNSGFGKGIQSKIQNISQGVQTGVNVAKGVLSGEINEENNPVFARVKDKGEELQRDTIATSMGKYKEMNLEQIGQELTDKKQRAMNGEDVQEDVDQINFVFKMGKLATNLKEAGEYDDELSVYDNILMAGEKDPEIIQAVGQGTFNANKPFETPTMRKQKAIDEQAERLLQEGLDEKSINDYKTKANEINQYQFLEDLKTLSIEQLEDKYSDETRQENKNPFETESPGFQAVSRAIDKAKDMYSGEKKWPIRNYNFKNGTIEKLQNKVKNGEITSFEAAIQQAPSLFEGENTLVNRRERRAEKTNRDIKELRKMADEGKIYERLDPFVSKENKSNVAQRIGEGSSFLIAGLQTALGLVIDPITELLDAGIDDKTLGGLEKGVGEAFQKIPGSDKIAEIFQEFSKRKEENPDTYLQIKPLLLGGELALETLPITKPFQKALGATIKGTTRALSPVVTFAGKLAEKGYNKVQSMQIFDKMVDASKNLGKNVRKEVAGLGEKTILKNTKLQKDDIDFQIKNPDLANKAENGDITLESMVDEVKTKINDFETKKENAGGMYKELEESPVKFNVDKVQKDAVSDLSDFLTFKDGKVESKGSSIWNPSATEKRQVEEAINGIANAVKGEKEITPAQLHKLRRNIDSLVYDEGGKKTKSIPLERIRDSLNRQLKENVLGMAEIDKVFSTKIQELQDAIKGFFVRTPEGDLTPTTKLLSIIDGSVDNPKKYLELKKLDKYFPGVSDQARAIKYAKNLAKSNESSPGLYGEALKIAKNPLTGAYAGSALGPVGTIAGGALSFFINKTMEPKNLLKIQKFLTGKEISVIKKAKIGGDLSKADEMLLKEAKRKFDLQKSSVPKLPYKIQEIGEKGIVLPGKANTPIPLKKKVTDSFIGKGSSDVKISDNNAINLPGSSSNKVTSNVISSNNSTNGSLSKINLPGAKDKLNNQLQKQIPTQKVGMQKIGDALERKRAQVSEKNPGLDKDYTKKITNFYEKRSSDLDKIRADSKLGKINQFIQDNNLDRKDYNDLNKIAQKYVDEGLDVPDEIQKDIFERAVYMGDKRGQQDYYNFVQEAKKLEAREQRIGKVGRNKVNTDYKKNVQEKDLARDRENFIARVGEHYRMNDTNRAYDMYDRMVSEPVDMKNPKDLMKKTPKESPIKTPKPITSDLKIARELGYTDNDYNNNFKGIKEEIASIKKEGFPNGKEILSEYRKRNDTSFEGKNSLEKTTKNSIIKEPLSSKKNTMEEIKTPTPVSKSPLHEEARKYKTAEEFVEKYKAKSIMDLSDREKHKYGRLLEDGVDEETMKYMDAKYTADVYGSRGNNDYKRQKDAKVPDVKSPEEVVTIYRGTIKSQKEMEPGDFVSFSKEYALLHNEGEKLITAKVPAKDVVWQGQDFNEWIYSPEKMRGGNTYQGGLKKIREEANTKPIKIPGKNKGENK